MSNSFIAVTNGINRFSKGMTFKSPLHALALIDKHHSPNAALMSVLLDNIESEEFGFAAELMNRFCRRENGEVVDSLDHEYLAWKALVEYEFGDNVHVDSSTGFEQGKDCHELVCQLKIKIRGASDSSEYCTVLEFTVSFDENSSAVQRVFANDLSGKVWGECKELKLHIMNWFRLISLMCQLLARKKACVLWRKKLAKLPS